jgi:hypothetical protein
VKWRGQRFWDIHGQMEMKEHWISKTCFSSTDARTSHFVRIVQRLTLVSSEVVSDWLWCVCSRVLFHVSVQKRESSVCQGKLK